MDWILKALIGAGAVILIQILAQSRSYWLVPLVPLFPTMTLISHYLVGTQRSVPEFRETILFGMATLVPCLLYMVTLFCLVEKCKLATSLVSATAVWLMSAGVLVLIWRR